MRVSITIPGLLADSVNGARQFDIEAVTLADAISALKQVSSALRTHIFDESGAIRRHILIYLNDESVTWIDDHAARVLRAGDRLHVIQAVSGG